MRILILCFVVVVEIIFITNRAALSQEFYITAFTNVHGPRFVFQPPCGEIYFEYPDYHGSFEFDYPIFSTEAISSINENACSGQTNATATLQNASVSAQWNLIPKSIYFPDDCSSPGERTGVMSGDVDLYLADTLFLERADALPSTVTTVPFKMTADVIGEQWKYSEDLALSFRASRGLTVITNIDEFRFGEYFENDQRNVIEGEIDFSGTTTSLFFTISYNNFMPFIESDYSGSYTARFRITLPEGVTCRSASGVFPGCDGEPSNKDINLTTTDITQAVSNPDVDNNGTIDLVLNRKTAILVNAEITGLGSEQVTIKANLLDQQNNIVQSVSYNFSANSNQPFELFFTPETEGEFNLAVEADPIPDEENEDNNSLTPTPVTVRATKQLVIPFVSIPDCSIFFLPGGCYGPLLEFQQHVDESLAFIQAAYPLPDDGIKSSLEGSILGGRTNIEPNMTLEERILRGLRSIWFDMVKVKNKGEKNPEAKRVVGVVPEGYFDYHQQCCNSNENPPQKRCRTGVHFSGIEKTVLIQEGQWSGTLHEIGHTYLGEDEGYEFNFETCKFSEDEIGNPMKGTSAPGYFVYGQAGMRIINNALDFMGTSTLREGLMQGPTRWVTKTNWEELTKKLDVSLEDPEIILIGVILNSDGTVELAPWDIYDTIPDIPKPGPYTLKLLDKDGSTLVEIPFDFVFSVTLDDFGQAPTDFAGIAYSIPYPHETALVTIIGPDGSTILEIDPVIKILKDKIEAIPDQCFEDDPAPRNELMDIVLAIEQQIKNNNPGAGLQTLKDQFIDKVNQVLMQNCNPLDGLATTKESLLELIQKTIPRLETRIDPNEPQPSNPPPVNPPNPDNPGGGNTPDPVIKLNQLDIPSILEGGEGVLLLNLTTDKALNDVEIQIQADGLTPTGVEVGDTLQTTKAVTGIDCNIEGDIITCAIDKIEDEASLSVGLKANDGVTGTRQVSVDITSNELESVVRFLFSVIVQAVSEPPPDDGGGNDEASNNGGCSVASIESKPRLELALLLPLFILARKKSKTLKRAIMKKTGWH